MFLQQLENAARVCEARIPLGDTTAVCVKYPGGLVVFSVFGIVAGKQTVFEVKPAVHNERRVGIVDDIILKVFVLFQNVVDLAPQKSDIRTGTKRYVEIAAGRCPCEAGIDVDQSGA